MRLRAPFRQKPRRAEGLTANQIVEAAVAELRAMAPEDWERRKVTPPWADLDGGCRSCGAPDHKFVALLAHKLPDERVLLFSFATVCKPCLDDSEKMMALGDRAFASLQ